ncbi:MAG TPA: hypothetical protein VJY39_02290 [Acidisphaera sp.]|nr:hypothetical protein [Acidisphaera sp.]
MTKSHTFSGVTLAVLQRMSETNRNDYVLVLDEERRTGTVTGKSPLGDVAVRFDYTIERAEMRLTVLKKPMFVPLPMLWAEFSLALREATTDLAAMQTDDADVMETP